MPSARSFPLRPRLPVLSRNPPGPERIPVDLETRGWTFQVPAGPDPISSCPRRIARGPCVQVADSGARFPESAPPPVRALFFFNDTATTEIYTLSHTTLFRSSRVASGEAAKVTVDARDLPDFLGPTRLDRKSTRLNSSHPSISYAVFCLKT